MDELTCVKYYEENGQNHESCDLSNIVFKDLDYRKIENTISFFRSDFSRSRFYDCYFIRNIFGRADFIDVYLKNTDFDSVDFGSCLIKNALLERVMFKSNNYHGVAIQYTYFKKCVFRDEDFITNMYHCEFHECTFINCTFKKSSLDCNTFSNCEFIKVDMSECIAENLKFDSCSLVDVYLCANLWTTYLYKNTDIYRFGFKYRGENVAIWQGSAKKFVKNLKKDKLYFEYLNALIIGDLIPSCGIAKELELLFHSIISLPSQIRKSTLVKILDMVLFYRNYSKIPFADYLSIYTFFANVTWGEDIPFEETLVYDAKLYKIRKIIEQLDFDNSYIIKLPLDVTCISKFHIDSEDSTAALSYLENVFDIANQEICGNAFSKPLFKVIKEEKGSIVLTIASAALLVLLVSYAAKKAMHNVFSIQVENSIKKKAIKLISSSDNLDLDSIKKSCALAQKYDLLPNENDAKQIDHLSSELVKGKILDIILNFLF